MKACSPRWAVIAPGAVFGAAMMGLSIHRILRASGDDPLKALVFFGSLIIALCVVAAIVVLTYRAASTSTQRLLTVLEEEHQGQAFAILKTEGLQADVATLTPELRGAPWSKRTVYAVVMIDADAITFWDGPVKAPFVAARLARREVAGVGVSRGLTRCFTVRAYEVALLHAGTILRVTFAPALVGSLIVRPVDDDTVVDLQSLLADTIVAPVRSPDSY
ncbi:hypothetical protein [Cryobacterium sp. CG_9.6]|uniref:hypothetical protein n=1 Tax=Cryobacterium sp. CG_9.6 TaxID=2760710 RepID=UPI0024756A25|nr:hypothetical protein [Cryobacterium sp. CG_9.6]MDH6236685.1 hypothetical protein [Cryobacterium sp. CG_9.6]